MLSSQRTWIENEVHEMEARWISGNEIASGAVVSKEGHTDSLLGHKKPHDYGFPWQKKVQLKTMFPFANFLSNISSYLLNDSRITD